MTEAARSSLADGVVIVDDHPLVTQAAVLLLRREGVRVAGTAGDADAGLGLIRRRRPAVVVVDLDLPPHGGRRLVEDIVSESLDVGVTVFTATDARRPLLDVLEAGAHAIVSKRSPLERLMEGVRAAARGDRYVDPNLATALRAATRAPVALSPRERAVLTLLARGRPVADIAASLGVSTETARTHLRNARTKLEARSSAQAVAVALQRGEIEA